MMDYHKDRLVYFTNQDYNILRSYCVPHRLMSSRAIELYNNHWLIRQNGMDALDCFVRAEIQTISYCNYQCQYCPCAYAERKKEVMSMTDFSIILDRLQSYGHIKTVCLHIYNEPTLDPYFAERIEALKAGSFQLELFTNGSGLNEKKVEILAKSGIVKKLVVNFPSLKPECYQELTRSKQYDRVLKNLDLCGRYGLPIYISVLSNRVEPKNLWQIRNRFPFARISSIPINDRGATLDNSDYAMNVHLVDQRLFGCFYFHQILYVGTDGACFPCINDALKQEYVYGNLLYQSVHEIISSGRFKTLQRKIMGLCEAEIDFRCRKCIYMKQNKESYLETWMPL